MFKNIKQKVQERFDLIMQQENVFVVEVESDELNNAYLAAFPEETRQEHNCSCCRHFLRDYGKVVAVKNGKLMTVWDFTIDDPEYANIPKALHSIVSKAKIADYFMSDIRKLGVDKNHQRLDDGKVIEWQHFFFELPVTKVYKGRESIASALGEMRTARNVFERSLNQLTLDSAELVLELISQGSLYRGDEYKQWVQKFITHKKAYDKLKTRKAKELYSWEFSKDGGKIRNSAIGTLLVDLSDSMDLETAVRRYENVVAPYNYKRPKALVTKKMIDNAQEQITELGYLDSLPRRHATPDDIPVSDVLFVNRNAQTNTKSSNDIFDQMKEDATVNPRTLSKVEEVSIDKFINDVLPTASSIEVLFENKHVGNLMSVIAPVNKDAKSLFPWDNGLSWDYKGNLADSMKEKVKNAGGKVDGVLRVSLEWFNYDDLDLHLVEPNGREIYYGNKRSRLGGHLDVDENAGTGKTRTPVENIIYESDSRLEEGNYRVFVNQYTKRESKDVGFDIELEFNGEIHSFGYDKSVRTNANIQVATLNYSKATGFTLVKGDLSSSVATKNVWNIDTNKFQKVSLVTLSPNHWDNNKFGNKHVFFIVDKVYNDEQARGVYNEFLKPELAKHRKVFEMLGSKMKVDETHKQLSGIGFSSTQRAELFVKVEGKFSRVVKVKF